MPTDVVEISIAMRRSDFVKRKRSIQKDAYSISGGDGSSSNDEEELKAAFSKQKTSPKGKKLRERTSSFSCDSDENIMVELSEKGSSFGKDHGSFQAASSKVEVQPSAHKDSDPELLSAKQQEEQAENILKTEKSCSDEQRKTSIENKMNILNTKKDKPTKNMYLFDYLEDEVSSDELQALQALSNYWVTKIAKNKDILKRAPPKTQQEQDFYNKYCDKEGKLSIASATHLMSLPYVITVCMKNNAQIEVVVSNREKALQESEELHQSYFEVVEAMAMHLM